MCGQKVVIEAGREGGVVADSAISSEQVVVLEGAREEGWEGGREGGVAGVVNAVAFTSCLVKPLRYFPLGGEAAAAAAAAAAATVGGAGGGEGREGGREGGRATTTYMACLLSTGEVHIYKETSGSIIQKVRFFPRSLASLPLFFPSFLL